MSDWSLPNPIVDGLGVKASAVHQILNINMAKSLHTMAYKSANETRTSATTPTDDIHLTAQINANELWYVDVSIVHSNPVGGTGNLRYQFSGPSDCVIRMTGQSWDLAGTSLTNQWSNTPTPTTGITNQTNWYSTTTKFGQHIRGLIYTFSQSGVFKLQWSQNASSANATTIYENSSIQGLKLGSNPLGAPR